MDRVFDIRPLLVVVFGLGAVVGGVSRTLLEFGQRILPGYVEHLAEDYLHIDRVKLESGGDQRSAPAGDVLPSQSCGCRCLLRGQSNRSCHVQH